MTGKEKGPSEYGWLYDPNEQPAAHEEHPTADLPPVETAASRHRLRRSLVVVTAAALLVGGMVATDYYVNHHGSASSPNGNGPSQTVVSGNTLTPKPPTQAECIAKLPMAVKLGQKLMISADASNISEVSAVMQKYSLGGVILMGPVPSAAATHALVEAQKIAPLVATDQEGGTVERYKSGGTLPAASQVPSLWSPAVVEERVAESDRYLKSQGVNMNLAPLADVAPASGSSVLGSRIFSADPTVVTTYARAYVQAGLRAGVLPTLKHFPGLGSTTGNTDFGSATVPPLSQLQTKDLVPDRNLRGTAAAVMVGNQIVPDLTDGLPASLSRAAVTGLRRNQLGYKNNVVITDSLSAAAITGRYSITDAAVMAWEAGNDIALTVTYGSGLTAEQQVSQIIQRAELAVKTGRLSVNDVNASVARLYALPMRPVDACSLAANKS
jgi:beta-N-acetylhexosaminidase